MNQFELKSVVNELSNLKEFADMALKVFEELKEENALLKEMVAGKEHRAKSTITVREISEDLGISFSTTVRLIQSGKIKGKKDGGRWMVLYKDYVRYRESA